MSAKGTVKATPGAVNVPIVCGGTHVNPGDVIVADDDGVVVVPRREAETVHAAGRARERARMRSGNDWRRASYRWIMYSMREPLARSGLVYVDNLEEVEKSL